MVSEDNLNSVSMEDDFDGCDYSDGYDDDGYGGYDDEDNGLLEDDDDDDPSSVVCRRPKQGYAILKEADIKQRQEDDISNVSTVLSISKVEATILLRRYNWNVNQVHEEWFADEERVRKSVGLLERPVVEISNASKFITCGICFESLPYGNFASASCGHPFCRDCWKGYFRTSINDGPGCLLLRCPEPSCKAAVGPDMIDKLATCEEKEKYSQFLLRSYIEDNRETKWCPAAGCENAVYFAVGSGDLDVTCLCSYRFCWNCSVEAHRPVDCDTVTKWMLKNSVDGENMNWILNNSKICPKCKRPIEKNLGCMHMTCRPPCGYEFCWLCLGPWAEHGANTGGFYSCNGYEDSKKKHSETKIRRNMAKNSFERYTHYYERWASNQSSREKALEDLHRMESELMEKLCNVQCSTKSLLKFISEAWLQIVECRRVLKWTYAYGYYLPEHEQTKTRFFEYLQGEAEAGLERLHRCAEIELDKFVTADGPSSEFDDFRTKLTGLTSVTKTYFENLVRALENGLEDVNSQETTVSRKFSSPRSRRTE